MTLLLGEDRPFSAPPAGAPAGQSAKPEGGLDQGVIEEARRRQRARRQRVALCGGLALTGAAVIVSALSAGGSPASPAAARRPVGALAARGHTDAAFGIRLSPSLDGGQYGWCVGVEEAPYAGIAGGGCSMMPVASTPVAMRLSDASVKTRTESVVLVTTPQVTAVLVNGHRRVPTVTLPGLPYGLRAVRVLTPLKTTTSPRGRPGVAPPREPQVVPLEARGRALSEPPLARKQPALLERPPAGAHSAAAPCSLRASGLPGLAAQWSHVASAIRPFAGALVGRAFFSCIDTEYQLQRWPLDAAILLDAAHPGSPPAAIPGLAPVAADPGYFNGAGDFKGELTATRFANAWLVIAGGSGLAQRIDVLRHLTPRVTFPPHG
jgi:hypothetical protein